MSRAVDNYNNSDDSSCNSNDYSVKRPLPVTIPNYSEMKNKQGDKYVAFNVHIAAKHLCSRRYKEFDVFHSLLKREFPDFAFPSFPKKWPFRLTEQQLEVRRRSLETYLDKSKSTYEPLYLLVLKCNKDFFVSSLLGESYIRDGNRQRLSLHLRQHLDRRNVRGNLELPSK